MHALQDGRSPIWIREPAAGETGGGVMVVKATRSGGDLLVTSRLSRQHAVRDPNGRRWGRGARIRCRWQARQGRANRAAGPSAALGAQALTSAANTADVVSHLGRWHAALTESSASSAVPWLKAAATGAAPARGVPGTVAGMGAAAGHPCPGRGPARARANSACAAGSAAAHRPQGPVAGRAGRTRRLRAGGR